MVFGPSNVDDLYATLPATGRYVLLVEGRISEGNTVDYSLRVSNTAPDAGSGATAQNFDAAGLPYATAAFSNAAATVEGGGPSGSFLRLLPGGVTGTNTVGFSSTGVGVIPASASVEFDLRITKVSNQGDGIGFAWLNADAWGNAGAAPSFAEEVNLARSFGVGFDPTNNGEVSDNHVSLHFDGAKLAEFNLTTLIPGFRLDDGSFHHARVLMTAVAGGSNVSVYLTPAGGSEVAVVQDYFISGMQAYDGRAAFGARNGGWRAHNDIDNLSVAVVPGAAEVLPQVLLGETVSATLGATNERDRYTFTLTEATRVYFDTLSTRDDSYYLRWSLSGPDGAHAGARQAPARVRCRPGHQHLELGPGTYTLSFWGENNISGAYSFALLDLGAATVVTPGEAVSGTLNPANETRRLYLRRAGRASALLRPDGTQRRRRCAGACSIPSATRSSDRPSSMPPARMSARCELAFDGRYTLLLEGALQPQRQHQLRLRRATGGGQQRHAATRPGGRRRASPRARRSATASAWRGDVRAYFDSLTHNVTGADSYYLHWSLTGPRGTVVSDRPFRQSDSYDGTIDPRSGGRRLHADGDQHQRGRRQLQLPAGRPGAGQPPSCPARWSKARSHPSNETDVYHFDAAAGDASSSTASAAAAATSTGGCSTPMAARCSGRATSTATNRLGRAHARHDRQLHAAGRRPLLHRRRCQLLASGAAGHRRDRSR